MVGPGLFGCLGIEGFRVASCALLGYVGLQLPVGVGRIGILVDLIVVQQLLVRCERQTAGGIVVFPHVLIVIWSGGSSRHC